MISWRLNVSIKDRQQPPPPFILQGDKGPPAKDGLGAPNQDASQGPIRSLGQIGGRSI